MKKEVAWVCLLLLAVTMPVMADWKPGEPAKFVQLPDMNGADVYNSQNVDSLFKVLADDFLCTSPTPITDIHFWGSWKGDVVGPITNVTVSFYDDIPVPNGAGINTLSVAPYSMPGQLRWSRNFSATEIQMVDYGRGQQSWYNPNDGTFIANDHNGVWQINIKNIVEPFVQEGTEAAPKIYWLGLKVTVADPATQWGWKTSSGQFADDAVWADLYPTGLMTGWNELFINGISKNLAFVITPEPATMVILSLGGLFLLKRRQK